MKGMVIDPRGRLKRRWFIFDLVLPNILAIVAIVVIRVMDLGLAGDLALGAIAALLIWSGNIAAPIARFHDLGLPSFVHLALIAVIFALTTIGPVRDPGELVARLGDWSAVLRGGSPGLPPVEGLSRQVGGLIALGHVLVLCFAPGQKGPNRFGPDPREKA